MVLWFSDNSQGVVPKCPHPQFVCPSPAQLSLPPTRGSSPKSRWLVACTMGWMLKCVFLSSLRSGAFSGEHFRRNVRLEPSAHSPTPPTFLGPRAMAAGIDGLGQRWQGAFCISLQGRSPQALSPLPPCVLTAVGRDVHRAQMSKDRPTREGGTLGGEAGLRPQIGRASCRERVSSPV